MDFNGSGALTERYLTNPMGLSQFYGQVNASGTTQWFLTDIVDSIRQVVSTNGTSLDSITYDPYGNIVNQTNSANAPRFLYAGGANDSITGNVQFGRRYYSSVGGRFASQDPLGLQPGTNPYQYAYNAPTTYTDSSGLMPNKDGAIDITEFTRLVLEYESQHIGEPKEVILAGLVDYFKNTVGWKYVYSTKYGWIDIPHFLTTASFTAKGVPPSLVDLGGILQEYNQAFGWSFVYGYNKNDANYHSAFTFEDLPSNRLGIRFAQEWGSYRSLLVTDSLTAFLVDNGATTVPANHPDYLSLPQDEDTWDGNPRVEGVSDPKMGPVSRAVSYTFSPFGLSSDLANIANQAAQDVGRVLPAPLSSMLSNLKSSAFSRFWRW
jgi:RHS repeat-associated protein